ncbi:MAG: NAD-dependent epimerase/dehydratase family protein [Caldilineales bacterium]|nr:NAD-dependent epimerase/dehydratase family protein [Caldilineales bacterium]
MPVSFVTGANGFLGAALTRQLLANGHEVRVLLRTGSDDRMLADLGVTRIPGDILDVASYRSALNGCDMLFHLAASYTHDPAQIAEMERVNIEGVRRVMQTAVDAGVDRIVHTSTIGVIGQPDDGTLANEETPFNLPDPTAYVRSKLQGERVATDLADAGAPIVIVNPVAMLGAGDWRPTASGRRVLDSLKNRLQRYPPGGINWCPVEDVARGMMLAAEKGAPGRRYILGHGQGNLDSRGFASLVEEASGQPLPKPRRPSFRHRLRAWLTPPESSSTSGSAPDRLTCNPSRAIVELGMPQSSLLAAAQASIQWYRENGYL